ncbi:osmoprotectant ABC transporter substrate-binding protein [Vagococcus fluvialis]|uniref:osmoprotectant ABC transporter substrate-binding protein n=1 Tax=Vagococcus fluvialis TaxID=2738 RepID=UPI001A90AEE8|nr:osmoprotectant ABC transporter substrate-binding protein [Vagococcus fluvialis]MBO0428080.1 osmoprotectant ABC transporter substrate-binding protein [Vagococcus fluvialis]
MKKKYVFSIIITLFLTFLIINPLFNREQDVITVSGGVTSESQIVGNMIVELINHETDMDAKLLNNLVSAQVNQVAMEKGELNIASVRYTGTDLVTTLGMTIEKDPVKALDIVQKEFNDRFNQAWFPSYGFANEFTFMVSKETAEKYNLKKVSDLREHAKDLTLGTDQGWYERENDGYQAFSEKYDMSFKRVFPMQVGLLYDALHNNSYDAILGYSTDGRISAYDLVLLEDDLQFFPPYTCSLVVDNKVLEKYPNLEETLHRLDNKITTETMQKLNYESDGKKLEPQIIAKQFLEENNYFREE